MTLAAGTNRGRVFTWTVKENEDNYKKNED
jgi:hypothetical protein